MSSAFEPTPLRPDAPAIPELKKLSRDHINNFDAVSVGGLTARQHAAITLCVPDSGVSWLDAMIDQRRRDEFAAKALAAVVGAIMPTECHRWIAADFSREAYEIADAMIAASKQ